MLRRFGPLYWLSGLAFFFRRLRIDESSIAHIINAHKDGPVVYVMYSKTTMDWIALNQTLNRRRLPLASYTAAFRSLWIRPILDLIGGAWNGLVRWWRKGPSDEQILAHQVEHGKTSLIFLVRSRGLSSESTGMLSALARIQARYDKPIQLLPVAVVWNRAPQKKRSDTARFLLGAEDEPGPIQKMLDVVNRDNDPIVQVGASINLPEILDHFSSFSNERQIRAIRLLLRRFLYRELHVVRGPYARPYHTVQRQVLKGPEVQNFIKQESVRTGKSEAQLMREAHKAFSHVAARFSYRFVRVASWCCRILWDRIYSGIDIREEDLERLRASIRAGTPILLPCHRSHLDYLLISSLCFEEGLVLPHIVAGENLAFFPIAPFLRRCGAFFIKRSFKGERVFPVVFSRYLRLLVRDEFPVELFVEGGRSRTGKLLSPKLGVLRMLVEASGDIRPDREVSLLPIAISYEQIAEEKTYARELSGASKQKESIRGLLRSRKIFRKRFGKVYLRVGKPIILTQALREKNMLWGDISQGESQEFLQNLGHQIMFGIGQNMLILPTGVTALALLAEPSKGLRIQNIQDRALRFNELLLSLGAQRADSMSHGGWVVMEALKRFLAEKWVSKMLDSEGDIIQIFPESRITLEYYKNSLIHFLAPISMLSSAILASSGGLKEIRRLLEFQTFLFRYEFPTHPDYSTEQLMSEGLKQLTVYNAAKQNLDTVEILNAEYLEELAGLTRNLVDSYRLVLRGCQQFQYRSITLKQLPHQLQEFGTARLAIDEVLYPEALSFVNINNAVRAYREERVLTIVQDGGLKLNEEACEQYIEELKRLLGG